MALELIDVSKRVGVEQHIYPTNLTLEPGGINILLGTTLSGKTTLMQLMAGLDQLTTGSLRFNGKDVTRTPVQKRNVSMVYQQFINYPNFSVFENIASPLRVARVAETEIKKRVGEMAELMKQV
ncbi:ATP-binding cassette domain-containing protein, partial [Roseibium sp.]|uniref:ATP-binding cassette domain-containing protein n=1 Tax=Roseibium sp. TaxID=1936156 RepID=UPI003A985106